MAEPSSADQARDMVHRAAEFQRYADKAGFGRPQMLGEVLAELGRIGQDLEYLAGQGALTGIAAAIAERRHQIETRGYTPAHDAEHSDGLLASGVQIYAEKARAADPGSPRYLEKLAQAAALAAAEIDRTAAGVHRAP